MLRIHRVILLDLVTTLILGMVVVTSVLFGGLVLQTMGRTQGLGFSFLLTLLPPLLPVAVAFGMPYSFLISVALVYGRMASDREVVALRISGVSPRVTAMPAIALGAVLSLVSLAFNGWVLPDAAQTVRIQSRNLVDVFLGQLGGAERTIALRRFRFSFGSYQPGSRPGGVGTFRDFELDLRERDGTLVHKMWGDAVRLARDGDELVIRAPIAYALNASSGAAPSLKRAPIQENVGRVEGLGLAAQFNDVVGSDRFEAKAKDVSLPDVAYLVQRGDTPKVPWKRSAVELHARVAGAFAPFAFGLASVAVSLLLTARSRRLTGILVSLLVVLAVHFPLAVAGKSLADGGRLPPWAGMWLADAALIVLGVGLLARAARR
ncbi:MAG TPA: LptF/LptG family permease [Planctomycetota bacterium]|nr:LptF/LptG family permease [Planctomycetota bacterium]